MTSFRGLREQGRRVGEHSPQKKPTNEKTKQKTCCSKLQVSPWGSGKAEFMGESGKKEKSSESPGRKFTSLRMGEILSKYSLVWR